MQPIIKDIILSISDDVVSNLTQSFEKTYYGKMNYSSKNTILDSDNKLLKETIGFEIAFIHVITYFLAYSMSCSHEYMHILNILDTDKLFSWFKIKDNSMFLQLNDCNIPTEKEIYELINEHDKFIDKNVKKKLGQFYTPTGIAKKMVFEVRNELKDLSERDLVVDPACGTGVFVVETVEQMSAFLSFDELIKFVENNMFAYDVNPFSVIATKISVLNTLLEIAPDSVHKNNLLLGIPALNNIKWKNTIVDKEEKEFSIILGNPPYFKLDSKALKDIDGYDAIIYGQPNIYSLFMHWGISHLRTNGTMSFIVPQSIRSGLYFKNLREEMKELRIKSILHIDSRQNIFDRAEQAVFIICLQNKPVCNTKTRIQFINGNQNVLSEFSISRSKLMMGKDNNYMFIINKKSEMYDVLEKVYKNGTTLSVNDSLVKFSNGLFVWNQHKESLADSSDKAIPIVYGGDVQPVNFQFITSWANDERKAFARITDKTRPCTDDIFSGINPAIIGGKKENHYKYIAKNDRGTFYINTFKLNSRTQIRFRKARENHENSLHTINTLIDEILLKFQYNAELHDLKDLIYQLDNLRHLKQQELGKLPKDEMFEKAEEYLNDKGIENSLVFEEYNMDFKMKFNGSTYYCELLVDNSLEEKTEYRKNISVEKLTTWFEKLNSNFGILFYYPRINRMYFYPVSNNMTLPEITDGKKIRQIKINDKCLL